MQRLGILVGLAAPFLGGCFITVGEGDIEPIVVDESFDLAQVPEVGCVEGELVMPGGRTLYLAPRADGCHVTALREPLLVFDEAQVAAQADELDEGGIGAVRAVDLTVVTLELTDEAGAPVPLDGLLVTVDDTVLLMTDDLGALAQGSPVTRRLSDASRDRLRDALLTRSRFEVDVEVQLIVADLTRLPELLELFAVIQPSVEIDVVDAVL